MHGCGIRESSSGGCGIGASRGVFTFELIIIIHIRGTWRIVLLLFSLFIIIFFYSFEVSSYSVVLCWIFYLFPLMVLIYYYLLNIETIIILWKLNFIIFAATVKIIQRIKERDTNLWNVATTLSQLWQFP